MLLINCPYCGERPEPEFVYGGQAHIARPQNPAAVPLGPLRVSGSAVRRRVEFPLGAFTRGDPLAGSTDIRFADRLVLDLVDATGKPVKTLTLPGGARELMPADYASRLTPAELLDLIAYLKRTGDNAVITCVNLDPAAAHEGAVVIGPELGLPTAFDVLSCFTGSPDE